jgi:nitrite reductase (cytochrome c-552)
MREGIARSIAGGTALLVVAGVLLFAGLRTWLADASEADVDPARWEARYPRHYAMTMNTRLDSGTTAFGGRTQYDKLAANPFRRRAFAGHPFELEYNSTRGHYYAQIDQRESRRTSEVPQPAACVQCHAAEGPQLVAKYGWEEFHRLSYDDVKDHVHHGTSCLDCHAADTLELRVSRPAFIRGMQQRGIDVSQASRKELRTYVCAQCHMEYYFRGEIRELVPPWEHGWRLEEIEQHFDDYEFHDWIHAETGAPLLKMQHPEFELYSTGTHARLGVSCVDCHMPQISDNGLQLTDHWIRSPLMNTHAACLNCHRGTEDGMVRRAEAIQRRTTEQLQLVEGALADLMDAIVAAREQGVSDKDLEDARRFHRRAQLRWDFIDAENSTGFHSPHETARLVMHALDLSRQGERSARTAIVGAPTSESDGPAEN